MASEQQPWVRGDWMQTFTGRRFYPMDPQAADVDPVDIAHALSLICRYGGHTTSFYSVAEHSVLLSHAVPNRHALWALLHDAGEAYVGDMVRPLKRSMGLYRQVEDAILVAIAERFGLDRGASPSGRLGVIPDEVHAADSRILLDERAQVMAPTDDRWAQDDLEPLGVTIRGWSPLEAELAYRQRLDELLLPNPDSYQWLGTDR